MDDSRFKLTEERSKDLKSIIALSVTNRKIQTPMKSRHVAISHSYSKKILLTQSHHRESNSRRNCETTMSDEYSQDERRVNFELKLPNARSGEMSIFKNPYEVQSTKSNMLPGGNNLPAKRSNLLKESNSAGQLVDHEPYRSDREPAVRTKYKRRIELHPNKPLPTVIRGIEQQRRKNKEMGQILRRRDNTGIMANLQASDTMKLAVLEKLEQKKRERIEMRQSREVESIEELAKIVELNAERQAKQKANKLNAFQKRRDRSQTFLKLNAGMSRFLMEQNKQKHDEMQRMRTEQSLGKYNDTELALPMMRKSMSKPIQLQNQLTIAQMKKSVSNYQSSNSLNHHPKIDLDNVVKSKVSKNINVEVGN